MDRNFAQERNAIVEPTSLSRPWRMPPLREVAPVALLPRVLPSVRGEWPGKRALDIVGALGLAALFAPFMFALTVWLWLAGGGVVLFAQERIGRGGRRFTCYKFATMVPRAEQMLAELLEQRPDLRAEWARDHKLRNDPRVTRLGRFLRRTSLDELPQLWNVLKADMSLVGPRPIVRQEIVKYRRAIGHYLSVKPGITGLWQVSGRNNTTYRRRLALDRVYAGRSSFVLDVAILLRTVRVVLAQKDAY
jgi:exopolysaccharide production protein ExoY